MSLQCAEGHEVTVECGERRCWKDADVTLCQKHYEESLGTARDEQRDQDIGRVEEVLEKWEGVVDIDNAVSIEGLKKEIKEAISRV